MRILIIAFCVSVLTLLEFSQVDAKKELLNLEIKYTKLEIEKLEFELSIYREQDSQQKDIKY